MPTVALLGATTSMTLQHIAATVSNTVSVSYQSAQDDLSANDIDAIKRADLAIVSSSVSALDELVKRGHSAGTAIMVDEPFRIPVATDAAEIGADNAVDTLFVGSVPAVFSPHVRVLCDRIGDNEEVTHMESASTSPMKRRDSAECVAQLCALAMVNANVVPHDSLVGATLDEKTPGTVSGQHSQRITFEHRSGLQSYGTVSVGELPVWSLQFATATGAYRCELIPHGHAEYNGQPIGKTNISDDPIDIATRLGYVAQFEQFCAASSGRGGSVVPLSFINSIGAIVSTAEQAS